MRISELPSISSMSQDDSFVVDGSGGTKKITGSNIINGLLNTLPPEMHRVIYRGKCLGTSFTQAQLNTIVSGTFNDIWLGDYWYVNGKNWRIVDIDYWYNCLCSKHHIVIMPDTSILAYPMYTSTGTHAEGYYGSNMRNDSAGLKSLTNTIQGVFGINIIIHQEYFVNSIIGGVSSGRTKVASTVEIPTMSMIFGHNNSVSSSQGLSASGTSKTQLSLFSIAPKHISIGTYYWLRDVVAANKFASVDNSGMYQPMPETNGQGVRPVFAIGG